jgi:hypothetical protein
VEEREESGRERREWKREKRVEEREERREWKREKRVEEREESRRARGGWKRKIIDERGGEDKYKQ